MRRNKRHAQSHVRDVMLASRYGEERKLTRVQLIVDWQRLFEAFGDRAIRNKGGKTRLLKGIIEARAKRVDQK
jgi:hypothetical protein